MIKNSTLRANMTISEALAWAKKTLAGKGVEGARSSAEFLLGAVLGLDKTQLILSSKKNLTNQQLKQFQAYIERRSKHEPVWYITGEIEFLGLDFKVNKGVLIPRPETELLIEKIAEHIRDGFAPQRILDVGTGSGAIIISVANLLASRTLKTSDAEYFASDISEEALDVAKKNSKLLGFAQKIIFKQGDLFAPWSGQKFDLIVTNLPYIPRKDMSALAPDLAQYEPHTALDGGHHGLEVYNRFFDEVGEHLNPGGRVFCEIGYEQGDKIRQYLMTRMPKAMVTVLEDYANVDRIVIIEAEPRTF